MEIRKLNMLRGLAALIVAVSHFSNSTKWLNTSFGAGAGQFGVMLFFLLSGFLISYLYMSPEFNSLIVKKYTASRIARILPLFFMVVVCSYVLKKIGIEVLYTIHNMELLVSNLLLLKGQGALWCIPAIVQFYAIFIPLWWLCSRSEGHLYILIASLIVGLFLMGFPVPKGELGSFPYDIRLFRSLPYFLVGVIFGRIYTNWKAPKYLSSHLYVLILLVIPLMYPRIYVFLANHRHGMWSDMGVLIVMSLIFFSILFLVPDDNPFLSNKVWDFLGKVSYPMYLLHTTMLSLTLNYVNLNLEILLVIFLSCTLIVSYAFYRLVEIPSARLIRRIVSINRI